MTGATRGANKGAMKIMRVEKARNRALKIV